MKIPWNPNRNKIGSSILINLLKAKNKKKNQLKKQKKYLSEQKYYEVSITCLYLSN
jgi:hypothetical protein